MISQSPCPMLNSLCNEGKLRVSDLTAEDLINALVSVGVSSTLASTLSNQAVKLGRKESGTYKLNLSDLYEHNAIEHDASFTRKDYYFDEKQSLSKDHFLQFCPNALGLSKQDLVTWKNDLRQNSKNGNLEYVFNFKQQFASIGETAMLYDFLQVDQLIPYESLYKFFIEERLPKVHNDISFFGVLATIASLKWIGFSKYIGSFLSV